MIDERGIEYIYCPACRACLGIGRPIHEARHSGMNQGARAHHAGFERNIQRCINNTIITQGFGASTQRHDFRMRSWVMAGYRAIPAFADHPAVFHQHGPDGHFAFVPGPLRALERLPHPVFRIQHSAILRDGDGKWFGHGAKLLSSVENNHVQPR